MYKDLGERFKRTIAHKFINIYPISRRSLLQIKDSREATKNLRPYPLDEDLQNREHAFAASLVSRDKGNYSSNSHQQVIFGKYGSHLASSNVEGLHPSCMDMWSASKSGKTWKSSQTGFRAYIKFCNDFYDSPPIDTPSLKIASHFIAYLYKARGRSGSGCAATTVCNYLSQVRSRFQSMSWNNDIWYDNRIVALVNGAKNMDQVKVLPENTRRVVTFDILRIYADSLAREPMMPLEYLNLWTASLIYFWCSFRPSDVLPDSYNLQSVCTALRWGDIRIKNPDSYTILFSPKISERGGDDIVSLVRFKQEKGKVYCPIHHLDLLMAQHHIMKRPFLKHDFVFRNEDGRPMLQKHLNYQLKKHLWPIFPDSFFSCYSVRAGLLNDYAEHSDLFTEEELRSTGKWQSQCYLTYLRTSGKRRDTAVEKIQKIFNAEVNKKN